MLYPVSIGLKFMLFSSCSMQMAGCTYIHIYSNLTFSSWFLWLLLFLHFSQFKTKDYRGQKLLPLQIKSPTILVGLRKLRVPSPKSMYQISQKLEKTNCWNRTLKWDGGSLCVFFFIPGQHLLFHFKGFENFFKCRFVFFFNPTNDTCLITCLVLK